MHLMPALLGEVWREGVESILLCSCPHHNKELEGRDTLVKQSQSFIQIHSKGGADQSQGRQRQVYLNKAERKEKQGEKREAHWTAA